MPLISVIIPVYNAEKYIHRCLDSILAQTHTNWEAILVDDGSPDNSGDICDEYALKDNRFKVIHQENGGVSIARQTGLDNTTGDYIIHCDPDDWVEPNMLEEMLQCATTNNADMVICDFIEEYSTYSSIKSQHIKQIANSKYLRDKLLRDELFGVLWNKLIKKEYIENIRFTPTNISYSEDELFIIRALNREMTIAYLDKAFYHYNRISSSITNNVNDTLINSKIIVISEYEKFINTTELDNLYEMKYHVLRLLFYAKKFKELKYIYPEIHKKIIKRNTKYNFMHPIGFWLAMALKGLPRISFLLFKINNRLIVLTNK